MLHFLSSRFGRFIYKKLPKQQIDPMRSAFADDLVFLCLRSLTVGLPFGSLMGFLEHSSRHYSAVSCFFMLKLGAQIIGVWLSSVAGCVAYSMVDRLRPHHFFCLKSLFWCLSLHTSASVPSIKARILSYVVFLDLNGVNWALCERLSSTARSKGCAGRMMLSVSWLSLLHRLHKTQTTMSREVTVVSTHVRSLTLIDS